MLKRPEQLNSWLETKKAPKDDLPFLRLIKTEEHYSILVQALEKFSIAKPSYSEGIKILELITEIIMLNPTQCGIQGLFEGFQSSAGWLKHLTQLRYPTTSQRDRELEKKMLSLPWPYGSKVKFERRGDRAGVELKMFITSEADLIKIVSSLERVKMELQN